MWSGMMQGSLRCGSRANGNKRLNEKRIHPTQKPVALYKWLLKNYAKPGDKILDTHGGSGSILIACHDLGFSIDWYEIDTEYFNAAKERLERHQRQAVMTFDAPILPTQEALL
jgi:site-specific DNA-methyltransferase (adenine-specific)